MKNPKKSVCILVLLAILACFGSCVGEHTKYTGSTSFQLDDSTVEDIIVQPNSETSVEGTTDTVTDNPNELEPEPFDLTTAESESNENYWTHDH